MTTTDAVDSPRVTLIDRSAPAGADADVALAVQGDTAAFERLYRAHLPRIYGLARRMAGPEAADELVQDVFVRAWQKLGTFRGDASLATWLHRLAVNVIVERFRTLGTARNRFLADGETALERMPSDRPDARVDLRMDLQAAIGQLPPGARAVFVLHDVEGYRHTEIGDLLGVSAGTSKSQLHRARMTLRGLLGRGSA
jgi:RNA polymerase sigma-70 factor, ECF subfamily